MKYHPEVCDYMAARPGIDLRMIEIIRHIRILFPDSSRSAVNQGCHDSVMWLRTHGFVIARRPKCFGGYGTYRWL